MTADLATVLSDYRTGLDTELALLVELEVTATRQRALPASASPDDLTTIATERERQLAALAGLEQHLTPLRHYIQTRLAEARRLPGFEGIVDRHRRLQALVASINTMDTESLETLKRADQDRRAATQSLETGEATLAAYRRILQQPQPSAGLFTQRG